MVISKKLHFFGQTLVFLPLEKPGLYISRKHIFACLSVLIIHKVYHVMNKCV